MWFSTRSSIIQSPSLQGIMNLITYISTQTSYYTTSIVDVHLRLLRSGNITAWIRPTLGADDDVQCHVFYKISKSMLKLNSFYNAFRILSLSAPLHILITVIDCGEPELDSTLKIPYANTTLHVSDSQQWRSGLPVWNWKNASAPNTTQITPIKNVTWSSYLWAMRW